MTQVFNRDEMMKMKCSLGYEFGFDDVYFTVTKVADVDGEIARVEFPDGSQHEIHTDFLWSVNWLMWRSTGGLNKVAGEVAYKP